MKYLIITLFIGFLVSCTATKQIGGKKPIYVEKSKFIKVYKGRRGQRIKLTNGKRLNFNPKKDTLILTTN